MDTILEPQSKNATKIQRWWKKLPTCRRCGSIFYTMPVVECGYCYFSRCQEAYSEVYSNDDEVNSLGYSTWTPNYLGHKLYYYGVGKRIRVKAFEQAEKRGLPCTIASRIAEIAVDAALITRSETFQRRFNAETVTRMSLAAGKAVIENELDSYSSATTSASVGSAGGVY